MFKSRDIKTQLKKYFTYLGILIEEENLEGRTDINNECEDIFKEILNIIYDLNLENMNEVKINYPAIDLGDEKNKVCYQITSNVSKKKIDETIKKFDDHKLYRKFDEINILFLKTDQRKHYQNSYNGHLNFKILFLSDLLKYISESGKEEKVLSYLKEEVGMNMIEKNKNLYKFEQMPMLDICNDRELTIFDYDGCLNDDVMFNFYGNSINFINDDNREDGGLRLELDIINSGEIPINDICIDNFSISYNTKEIDWDSYFVEPVCEYSEYKDINNLFNPKQLSKLNIIFQNNNDDKVRSDLIIELALDIFSDYSKIKNTMQFRIFCGATESLEETIIGKYKIIAIKVNNQVNIIKNVE
jgi:hypothetical protein